MSQRADPQKSRCCCRTAASHSRACSSSLDEAAQVIWLLPRTDCTRIDCSKARLERDMMTTYRVQSTYKETVGGMLTGTLLLLVISMTSTRGHRIMIRRLTASCLTPSHSTLRHSTLDRVSTGLWCTSNDLPSWHGLFFEIVLETRFNVGINFQNVRKSRHLLTRDVAAMGARDIALVRH